MKTKLLKTMSWIAEHLETVIALVVLGVGQLAGYLNLRFEVGALRKQSDQDKKTLDDHVGSPVLHRTPDFERGQAEIKSEMIRINDKLDRVLELLPRRS